MNFNSIKGQLAKSEGQYVKLPGDGDSIAVVLLGEVYVRSQHWTNDGPKVCIGKANDCEHCEDGHAATVTYMMNVLDVSDFTVRIYDMSKALFREVVEEFDGVDDVSSRTITIKRQGVGKATRWRCRLQGTKATAEQVDDAMEELHALDEMGGVLMSAPAEKPAKKKGKGKKAKKHVTRDADEYPDDEVPF